MREKREEFDWFFFFGLFLFVFFFSRKSRSLFFSFGHCELKMSKKSRFGRVLKFKFYVFRFTRK